MILPACFLVLRRTSKTAKGNPGMQQQSSEEEENYGL
jgi:hypothetical protein